MNLPDQKIQQLVTREREGKYPVKMLVVRVRNHFRHGLFGSVRAKKKRVAQMMSALRKTGLKF